MVGRLYLLLEKMLPSSVSYKNGETYGDMPPSRSCSARLRQILSSYSESPPSEVDMKTPSGSSESW